MPFFYVDLTSLGADCLDSLDGFWNSAQQDLSTQARLTGVKVRRFLSRGRRVCRRVVDRLRVAGMFKRSESADKRPIIKKG